MSRNDQDGCSGKGDNFRPPPNTTHLAQPLDKGCFAPLKSAWKQVVQVFTANNHQAVTRSDFCSLFSEAWYKGMSMKNVLAGFKVCGIYPFNKAAIVLPEERYTSFKPEALPQISGLKYIPMYSPMRPPARSTPFPSCSPQRFSFSSPIVVALLSMTLWIIP